MAKRERAAEQVERIERHVMTVLSAGLQELKASLVALLAQDDS